jgi:hypothetical protein
MSVGVVGLCSQNLMMDVCSVLDDIKSGGMYLAATRVLKGLSTLALGAL